MEAAPTANTIGCSIAAVYFLNPSHGWVAVVDTDASGVPTLRVLRTSDGGHSWLVSVAATLSQGQPVGAAAFDFLPNGSGVVSFDEGSHDGVSYGALFITNDSGATWGARKIPGFAPVRLMSPTEMWFVGGSGTGGLHVSHDGGSSWIAVTLTPPADFSADTVDYGGAEQRGATTARTIATVSFTSSSRTDAIGYDATSDNGETWTLRSTLKVPNPEAGASATVQIVDAQDWITAFAGSQGRNPVEVSSDSGARWQEVVPLPGAPSAFSFTDPLHGWAIIAFSGCSAYKSDCFSARRLYSTSDGGNSWEQVNLS